MVTFTGRVTNGEGVKYFQYGFDVNTDGVRKDCGGWSIELLNGQPGHGFNRETLAWGYDGYSPDLLSVNMLAISLYQEWLSWPNYVHCHQHPDRDLILKHYRAFTEEIVANLPDEWTMTSDEVLAWVKKKEASCS